jgi:hypothetical protein
MTTPDERTKAVVDTRDFLRTLATAQEITIQGLVQTVATHLLKHYPLDVDLVVSAAALPEIWACPKQNRDGMASKPEQKREHSIGFLSSGNARTIPSLVAYDANGRRRAKDNR